MDRLTVKYDGKWHPKALCTIDRFGEADDCDVCPGEYGDCSAECEECPVQKCFDRLAAYEDIGLTPEQLREVDKLYSEKCKEVADMERSAAITRLL